MPEQNSSDTLLRTGKKKSGKKKSGSKVQTLWLSLSSFHFWNMARTRSSSVEMLPYEKECFLCIAGLIESRKYMEFYEVLSK